MIALTSRPFRSLCTAVALLVGGCASAQPDTRVGNAATTTEPVRAMSFNIRYGTAPDGDHEWTLRRHLTFRVIRDFDPTLLGVQEALRFQLDEITAEMPHLTRIGVGRDDGLDAGEYSAIVYDRRRLDVIDQGTFWLSDTPDVPGSMSWGNGITRIATWAHFRDRATDSRFFVFNTHWDHESQPSRERSAALLLDRIRERGTDEPVIVMGDFNAGEDNAAFQALVATSDESRSAATRGAAAAGAVRLYDTFRAVHPDARSTGTFHAFRGVRSGPKIDAILASPEWHTLDAEIVLFNESGLYPSDHFPVTAVLRLDARGPP